jgi:hypothetical protein
MQHGHEDTHIMMAASALAVEVPIIAINLLISLLPTASADALAPLLATAEGGRRTPK